MCCSHDSPILILYQLHFQGYILHWWQDLLQTDHLLCLFHLLDVAHLNKSTCNTYLVSERNGKVNIILVSTLHLDHQIISILLENVDLEFYLDRVTVIWGCTKNGATQYRISRCTSTNTARIWASRSVKKTVWYKLASVVCTVTPRHNIWHSRYSWCIIIGNVT